jgi:hypothetical protein
VRRRVAHSGPVQMFVVAGLPKALSERANSILRELVPGEINVVSLASAEDALYRDALVSGIVRAVAGFAIRRRTHGSVGVVAPSSITLMYVPAPDEDRLLRRFDFAVFPVPLAELAARDAKGHQLRHSYDAVRAALARAVAASGPVRTNQNVVRERANRRDGEALLLPPNNFQVEREVPVSRLFLEILRGDRPWTDRLAELRLGRFTKENLPHVPPQQTRKAFQDHRGLVFLTAHPTAYHGQTREIERDITDAKLLSLLKSLYRFGAALPNGFHHDAQLEHAKSLAGLVFDCCMKGAIQGNGSHANIYPNDFVRF